MLERLAKALSIDLADLLVKPAPKERPPKPLVAERKSLNRNLARERHVRFWPKPEIGETHSITSSAAASLASAPAKGGIRSLAD